MKMPVVNLYTDIQTKVMFTGFFQTAEEVCWVKGVVVPPKANLSDLLFGLGFAAVLYNYHHRRIQILSA